MATSEYRIDRSAYDFFRRHAGGIVGRNVMVAASLARAEKRAEHYGLEVEWDWECESPEDVFGEGVWSYDLEGSPTTCVVRQNGVPLASLGMCPDPFKQRDYCRVIEAELKAEALEELYRLDPETMRA